MDVLFEKILDAEAEWVGQKEFRNLLSRSWLLDGQPRTKKQGQKRAKNQDHSAHNDVFGDRRLRILWRHVEPREECQGKMPEVVVHEQRQSSNVFGHSLVRGMQDFVHTRRDCGGS